MANWIQIPEGKTEVRLKDGSWVEIPEGKTEIDADMLWSGEDNQEDEIETPTQEITAEETKPTELELIDITANKSREKLNKLIEENPDMEEHYSKALLSIDEAVANKKLSIEEREVKKLKLEEAKQKMSKRADGTLDRATDVVEGTARGALRMVLGTGKLGQDLLGKLTHTEYKQFDEWIQQNEQWIKDKGLEADALVGEIASNILPAARLRSLGYIVGAEGLMATTASLGSGEDYATATKKGATAAVMAGVTGKIFNKLFPDTPVDKIDTDFKKQISKLDLDDQNRINTVLDELDRLGVKKMDNEARDTLLAQIFAGKKSTAEISKDVVKRLQTQAKVAKRAVDREYAKANEIAKDIEVKDKITFDYKPKNKDEVKIFKDAKSYLEPKYNTNLEEVEATIQALNRKLDGANGTEKYIYGQAKKAAIAKQTELGGEDIYKNARKLSKEYNTEFTGVIKEGEEATAGATTAKVLEKQYTEEAGEALLSRKVNLNKVGKAAMNLKPKQKQQVIQDILIKDLAEDGLNNPEAVRKILTNYKNMDKKGLVKFLGKDEANKLDVQMKSLNEVELAIKSAKGQELNIGDDVLALATAGATVKLSPYLAARSTIYASKNIVKKFTNTAEKAKLIERVKTIKDTRTRTIFMKAIGLGFSSIHSGKLEEEKED